MSTFLLGFSVLLFWLGPPLVVLIAGMMWFAARRQHATPPVPWRRFWFAVLAYGVAGAAAWAAMSALLMFLTQANRAGVWFVFLPWACAMGEALGVYRLRRVLQ